MESILNVFHAFHPDRDGEDLIRAAFEFALEKHSHQFRLSGEPYIEHPVQVAKILADLGSDEETIAAGFLHDVIEDCEVSPEELTYRFGSRVTHLISGVTKLSEYTLQGSGDEQVQNFRKLLLAVVEDLRVIIVKLADRLHNMQTLQALPADRQKNLSDETLQVYAPIAHRLGMWNIMAQLEDHAFSVLEPDAFSELKASLHELQPRTREFMDITKRQIRQCLDEEGIQATLRARMKHLYSIYKKMKKRGFDMDRLFDILAFRIITPTEEDCYRILSVLHRNWEVYPDRLKDYISIPKANSYRSIHTTLMSQEGNPFEVQIRTEDMHRQAEKGIAAHILYKEEIRSRKLKHKELLWVSRLAQILEDADSFDKVRLSLLSDDLYILTPGGDVIALPNGSTVLDFAYRIHTDVGHRTTGALVNNRIVPLSTILRTGDEVTIMTHPRHKPSRDWLTIVNTSSAKTKIKQFLRKEERTEQLESGKKMVDRFFRDHAIARRDVLGSEPFREMLENRGFSREEDLYCALGASRVSLESIFRFWLPGDSESDTSHPALKEEAASAAVLVGGEQDLEVCFARCCYPVPGDDIMALSSRSRGIVIHQSSCSEAARHDRKSFQAIWMQGRDTRQECFITILTENNHEIETVIKKEFASAGLTILEFHSKKAGNSRFLFTLLMTLPHADRYLQLRQKLLNQPGIYEVSRAGDKGKDPNR